MNKLEFRKVTEMLEENYNKKLDLRILGLWFEEFKDYPTKIYEEIVIEIISKEKFMPSLAIAKLYKKPIWLDAKIEKEKPSEEEKKELDEILKNFN